MRNPADVDRSGTDRRAAAVLTALCDLPLRALLGIRWGASALTDQPDAPHRASGGPPIIRPLISRNLKLAAIAAELNAQGVRTARGGAGHPSTVSYTLTAAGYKY